MSPSKVVLRPARGGTFPYASRHLRFAPLAWIAVMAAAPACGSHSSEFSPTGGSSGSYALGGSGSSSGSHSGSGALTNTGPSLEGGIPISVSCSAGSGSQCVATCSAGSTTYSGQVYDPAGRNPLYNVAVYVPTSPLPDLPSGAGCGCASLFPTTILTSTATDADGRFTLTNAPTGKSIPLVVQAGKWRMLYHVEIDNDCQDNVAPDHSLRLPRDAAEGNLPDIAISTGGADSLECLPFRIGVDATEFVAGESTAGHIHIFSGFAGATTASGAPSSPDALWDSTADLAKNDVVLLSCEGQETAGVTSASQQSLLDYASLGGRVFASHYHYVWFDTGAFDAFGLARWMSGPQIVVTNDTSSVPAEVDSTLASGQAFPEGAALQEWLTYVGALTDSQLPIWYARDNVSLLSQPPSVEWIHLDPGVPQAASATQYFSVDAPIGASSQCGRVVYSDLHVSGGPGSTEPGVAPDYPDAGHIGTNREGGIVPAGCAQHPLTPQEEALEFMLFDLSSCLVPIGGTPYVPR